MIIIIIIPEHEAVEGDQDPEEAVEADPVLDSSHNNNNNNNDNNSNNDTSNSNNN